MGKAEDYNYADFDLDRETPHFLGFRKHLHAGEKAPDGPLTRLDDRETVILADYHREGPVVVEFGSFT